MKGEFILQNYFRHDIVTNSEAFYLQNTQGTDGKMAGGDQGTALA